MDISSFQKALIFKFLGFTATVGVVEGVYGRPVLILTCRDCLQVDRIGATWFNLVQLANFPQVSFIF